MHYNNSIICFFIREQNVPLSKKALKKLAKEEEKASKKKAKQAELVI